MIQGDVDRASIYTLSRLLRSRYTKWKKILQVFALNNACEIFLLTAVFKERHIMKTIQTILMFLATPLLVAFTSQSARGFSLSFAQKGARDLYIAKQSKTYTQGMKK